MSNFLKLSLRSFFVFPLLAAVKSDVSLNLWKAASVGDFDIAMKLFEKGANVNFIHPSKETTPVMEAMFRDRKDIIYLLLESAVDVNLRVQYVGATALQYAAMRGVRVS